MRKIILLGIIILVSSNYTFAQQKKRKKKSDDKISLSLLLNSDFNNTLFYVDGPNFEIIEPFSTQITSTNRFIRSINEVVNIGFSYQKLNNNNKYTEFSLTKFLLSKDESVEFLLLPGVVEPINGATDHNFEMSFRFEYGSYFTTHDESKLRLGIGGGLAPYFVYQKYEPKTSASFTRNIMRYGLKLEFVPSISYKISKNSFIDFKWSPSIFDFNRHQAKVQNPILTENQRKSNYTIPGFFNTPLSFQLHYRYQILGARDAKKKLTTQRKQKSDETAKKKGVTFITPILNINSQNDEVTFKYNIDRRLFDFTINRTSLLNLGIGLQLVKENGIYHEIALTRLSFKQDIADKVTRFPNVPNMTFPVVISESQADEWGIGLRYEIGKVFTDPYRNKQPVIFSIGLAVEPFYNNFKVDNITQGKFNDFGADLKVMPAIAFKLSNRHYLQLKWTPTIYRGQHLASELKTDDQSPVFTSQNWNFEATPNLVNGNVGIKMRI